MLLSFKCDSSCFKLSTFNQRLTTWSFFLTNRLSTFVFEIIQTVTVITCENEISRRRVFKFLISLKIFFSRRIYSIYWIFCRLWNAKERQTRQTQQWKHFSMTCCFEYDVVLNRSRSFYDCCRFFSLDESTRAWLFQCLESSLLSHVNWSCLFNDKSIHDVCTSEKFTSKTELEQNSE